MKYQAWTLLFLLLIVLKSSSLEIPKFPKVIGGSEAKPGQFPYAAGLQSVDDRCSASIISARWVISAAHCAENPDPTRYQVTAGTVDLDDKGSHFTQRRNVAVLRSHPNYTLFTEGDLTFAVFDIVLVELERSFEWTSFVKPIRLSSSPKSYKPGECVAIGFGLTSLPGRQLKAAVPLQGQHRLILNHFYIPGMHSGTLYYLPIESSVSPCTGWIPSFPLDNLLCSVGGEYGKQHLYEGDSGSPLVCGTEQVGVLSLVGAFDEADGTKIGLQIHSSVPHFYEWIQKVIY